MFDLFGGDIWDPLRDAFNMLYNEGSKDAGIEMLKLQKHGRTCYVGVVKCPGLERKDINIEFSDNNEDCFPTLRVRGVTETHLGTYKVDVGAAICIPERIVFSQEGTKLRNGILYIYFDPIEKGKALATPRRPRDPDNPDFQL